jgi:predicted membrane protein
VASLVSRSAGSHIFFFEEELAVASNIFCIAQNCHEITLLDRVCTFMLSFQVCFQVHAQFLGLFSGSCPLFGFVFRFMLSFQVCFQVHAQFSGVAPYFMDTIMMSLSVSSATRGESALELLHSKCCHAMVRQEVTECCR